jgi:hypothetical protein
MGPNMLTKAKVASLGHSLESNWFICENDVTNYDWF